MSDQVPAKIYLQWYGDDNEPDPSIPYEKRGEISWCADKVYRHDVEYFRAVHHAKLIQERNDLLAALQNITSLIFAGVTLETSMETLLKVYDIASNAKSLSSPVSEGQCAGV